MKSNCGCCEGSEKLTPLTMANRPGLPALSYRVGTHAAFLETMKARLSAADFPELASLKTRVSGDAAIALLDAWAVVGDVLTFYQERIANEGYLRTATERRSILELARLIGYTLRPGVASSVYLAYTLDEDRSVTPPKSISTMIPVGSRAQSIPGPNELPQSFETSEKLEATSQWNKIQVRLNRPQTAESILNKGRPRVYLNGIATNLKENDPLLIEFGDNKPVPFRIVEIQPDAVANRTLVRLKPWTEGQAIVRVLDRISEIVAAFYTNVVESELINLPIIKKVIRQLRNMRIDQGMERPPAELSAIGDVAIGNLKTELSAAEQHDRREQLVPLLTKLISGLTDEIPRLEKADPSLFSVDEFLSSSEVKTGELFESLLRPPTLPPANSSKLNREFGLAFADKSDSGNQLLATFQPALRDLLSTALSNAKVTKSNNIKVYAFRVKAAPFGSQSRKRSMVDRETGEVVEIGEWPIVQWRIARNQLQGDRPILHEKADVIFLDASYDKIAVGTAVKPSWIMIDNGTWELSENPRQQVTPASSPDPLITNINKVQADVSRADYGLAGKTTKIELDNSWIKIDPTRPDEQNLTAAAQAIYDVDFRFIRSSVVYAQSEELSLAEEPINDPVCHGNSFPIELDGWYSNLQTGRWLIVSGERSDVKDQAKSSLPVPGVMASELVMLAGVMQDVARPGKLPLSGDKNHSFIKLARNDLAYCYKRDTVVIYGNVVKATHGETRSEVLGGGDASRGLQQFSLRQPPLTFIAASNPSGVESTLVVRVNDVEWHETDSLATALPTDRTFVTRTDDDGKTTVVFGTGEHGARLPTGQENIKALYRNGIGFGGNVKAGQISLLASRPLGVKSVTNPLPATGGADKENRDQARENAPLAVMALD
ncbi:MAG: hypothetical protein ABL888_02650, partial [Pirellulaceae bacterium]